MVFSPCWKEDIEVVVRVRLVVLIVLGIEALIKAGVMLPKTWYVETFIVGTELSKFVSLDFLIGLLNLGLDDLLPARKYFFGSVCLVVVEEATSLNFLSIS